MKILTTILVALIVVTSSAIMATKPEQVDVSSVEMASVYAAVLAGDNSTKPDYGVRINVTTFLPGYWATTRWDDNEEIFIIDLSADLHESALIHTISHEWAHILTWDVPGEDDHGPMWGVAFAKCYRVLE